MLLLTGNTPVKAKSMSPLQASVSTTANAQIPPRERILAAASDLFYRQGIRAVGRRGDRRGGRHQQDDALPPLRLQGRAGGRIPALPRARGRQVLGRPRGRASGRPARAAARLARRHAGACARRRPARLRARQCGGRAAREGSSGAPRDRGVQDARSATGWSALCGATGIAEPELLADELFLLLEGARVSAQSLGPKGPASRLVRMGEALIASHLS